MAVSLRLLLLYAALAGIAVSQHAGDVPPALVWHKTKGNCPASLDWASLRDKVVVVSFMSEAVVPDEIVTWNELPGNFQGEPVVFIHVVSGSEFLLEEALKITPYQGCILLDTDRANRENFKLPSRFERTVIVDRLGHVAGYWRGLPDESSIRSVLNHRKQTGLFQTPPQPSPFNAAAILPSEPTNEIRFSPSSKYESRILGYSGPGLYISRNQTLKVMIADLWQASPARISFPETLDEKHYDILAHMRVTDREQLLQLVRDALQVRFRLRIDREVQMQRVYLLTPIQNGSSRLQPSSAETNPMTAAGQESIIGAANTMKDIAQTFEGLLNVPVIDETGLTGRYEYSVSSQLPKPGSAFDLARQLGLQLTAAKRPMELLMVRSVD